MLFKKTFLFFWEILKIAIVALVIVVPIRYFIFQPFIVRGGSMEPNFHSGDYLIIDEITYRFRSPERGEVVVFNYPKMPTQRYIKRIVGLPGEAVEIKDGKVFIYSKDGELLELDESQYFHDIPATLGNEKVILKEGEYFVLGDNRPYSSDSRSWGVLPRNDIIGRVFFRAWPFSAWAKIKLAPSN